MFKFTFYWIGDIPYFGVWYPAECTYTSFWRMVPRRVYRDSPQRLKYLKYFLCPIEHTFSCQILFWMVTHQVDLPTFLSKGERPHFGDWYPPEWIFTSFWRMIPRRVYRDSPQCLVYFICLIVRTFFSHCVQLLLSTVTLQVCLFTFYWKGVMSQVGEWYPAACISMPFFSEWYPAERTSRRLNVYNIFFSLSSA